jgi:hypothetical protein
VKLTCGIKHIITQTVKNQRHHVMFTKRILVFLQPAQDTTSRAIAAGKGKGKDILKKKKKE